MGKKTGITIKFKYPKDLSEITVEQYSKWVKVLGVLIKDKEPKDINFNEVVRQKISIFCNVPVSAVDMMPIDEIQDVSDHISRLIDDQNPKLIDSFKFGGVEFRLVPNFENMSFGEFVDANEFLKTPDAYNRLISVLYRPVKEKRFNKFLGIEQYKIEPYNSDECRERAELFNKLSADVIIGLTFFLLSSFEELQRIMKAFLQREIMENPQLLEDLTSVESMDGSTASTD